MAMGIHTNAVAGPKSTFESPRSSKGVSIRHKALPSGDKGSA